MSHLGPPSSRGAKPLAPEDLAFLKGLLERKSVSAEKLLPRVAPSCSRASFSRAKRGEKVSLAVHAALTELIKQLRSEEVGKVLNASVTIRLSS
jgi:hypothetical protein